MASSRTAFALLLCAIAALACVMPAQSDTWWLLRAGEETWTSGHIQLHDTFTHTVAGGFWPNHEWLSQVLFFAAYAVGGMPLLTALCAVAVVAASALVWFITPGETIDRVLLVGGAAAFSTAGWSLRPQVFTLALFALTLTILLPRGRARHPGRLLLLPLVFLVWANLHGGVAAGGVLVVAAVAAALVVERRVDGRLLMAAVLSFLATAVTPLGPRLWLEVPASLQRLKAYDVIEWRAPSLANPADLPFFAALAAAIGLCIVRRRELRDRAALFLATASALTTVLALRSSRNAALFFVCVVPLAARLIAVRPSESCSRGPSGPQIHRRPEGRQLHTNQKPSRVGHVGRYAVAAAGVATAAFAAYAWSRPLERLQWHPVSEQMHAALQACAGPLYNRYDEGGYLIWFERNRPVFIDSRQDPFPASLVQEQLDVERTGDYRQTFARYRIACALTPTESLLAANLRRAGWSAHDAGSGWVVYTRAGAGL